VISAGPRIGQLRTWQSRLSRSIPLTPVILAEFMDFVMVAKVAIVAIFPNVASVGIEERVVTPAVRELDTGVASLRHGGLRLKDWFQYEHRKKQSDDGDDCLCIKVNTHVSASILSVDFRTSQISPFLSPTVLNRCKIHIFQTSGR
jgi:hypothetical protein